VHKSPEHPGPEGKLIFFIPNAFQDAH
jgi:hypothetical protein